MADVTKEHGTIISSDSYPYDPLGRGIHSITGFNSVADETARNAITQQSTDRGRVIEQTGGNLPGYYVADGAGNWFYLGGDSDNTDALNLISLSTNRNVDLYVDNINGDDSNDGSQANPLKTLTEAESRLPFVIAHRTIIHLLPYDVSVPNTGSYEWPTFRARILQKEIVILSENFETVASGTAQAGTGQLTVVTTGGLTPDQYVINPAFIRFTSGAANGDYRMISENTATNIEPDYPFTNAPTSGDTYEIIRPLVRVQPQREYAAVSQQCAFAYGTGQRASSEHGGGRYNIVLVNLLLDMSQVEELSMRDVGVSFFGVVSINQIYTKLFSESGIVAGVGYEKGAIFPWVRIPKMIEWAPSLAINETSWSGMGFASTEYLGLATIGNGFCGFLVCREQLIIRANQNTANVARFEPSVYLIGGRCGGIQAGTSATFRGCYVEILAAGSAGQPHIDFKVFPGQYVSFMNAAIESLNGVVHIGHINFGSLWPIDGIVSLGIFSHVQVYQSYGTFGGFALRAKIGGKIENRGNCNFAGTPAGNDITEDDGTTIRAWATYVSGVYWNDLTNNTQAIIYYP